MKKLVWRLSKAPTVDELKTAVEASIITKDEAKEMLVRNEEDVPKDQLKEVKDELKLLRDLVMKIAAEKQFIPLTYPIIIREIKEYPRSPWIYPWITWSSTCETPPNGSVTFSNNSKIS